jgi:hypothetical protein
MPGNAGQLNQSSTGDCGVGESLQVSVLGSVSGNGRVQGEPKLRICCVCWAVFLAGKF